MNKLNTDISKEIISNPLFKEQLKAIVLERTKIMPESLRIAIGSEDLKRDDLIEHIKVGDEIGQQMMIMELEFLRALTSGAIYAHE